MVKGTLKNQIRKSKKDLPVDYTTALFALQKNKTNLLQASRENPACQIFAVRDHIDADMLANKVTQDLYDHNPNAKQLARDSRKVQMTRSNCKQAAYLPGLVQRNITAMNPSMIPSEDQTISMLLNHPDNDPFNKPTIIKVMLVPEAMIPAKMEIHYREMTKLKTK